MSDPITVTDLTQVGRTNAYDPSQPRVYVTYPADFNAAADVTLDFTLLNQTQQFGTVRGLFIDNGTNPAEVVVSVSLTGQTFSVPAYAEGYFKIDGAINSNVRFVTNGGATQKVTITLYNYDVAPNVWYKFGPTSIPNPLPVSMADGADVAEGSKADAAYTGSGSASVIALLKGLWASFFGVASGATDSGNPVKIGGRHNSALPTFTNGQRGDLQIDANGRQLVAASGDVAAASADSGNPLKIGSVFNTTAPTYTNGQRGNLQMSARGSLNVQLMDSTTNAVSIAAPSADALATSGFALFTRAIGYLFNGSTFDRTKKPNTTNRLLSAAASTNATNVKGSAGDLFKIKGRNTAAAARYLKLYNKATAPTVGTDTPVQTYFLAAGADFEITFDTPYYFSLGIGFGLTVNAADADTTALTAGDIVCQNIVYQ